LVVGAQQGCVAHGGMAGTAAGDDAVGDAARLLMWKVESAHGSSTLSCGVTVAI
jgi:hypothetical protein